jgi:hypothetical protein
VHLLKSAGSFPRLPTLLGSRCRLGCRDSRPTRSRPRPAELVQSDAALVNQHPNSLVCMLRAAAAATRTSFGSRIVMASHRTTLSSPAASQARSLATAPIGNPLAAEKYSSGREAALKWAKENGYSEECLVELPVQWGEQGQHRVIFPSLARDLAVF